VGRGISDSASEEAAASVFSGNQVQGGLLSLIAHKPGSACLVGVQSPLGRFIRNLGILLAILVHKPKSVYELAKLVDMDVSNLNKIILFFETVGAIKIKTSTVSGRTVKTPVVEHEQIEFDLKVA